MGLLYHCASTARRYLFSDFDREPYLVQCPLKMLYHCASTVLRCLFQILIKCLTTFSAIWECSTTVPQLLVGAFFRF